MRIAMLVLFLFAAGVFGQCPGGNCTNPRYSATGKLRQWSLPNATTAPVPFVPSDAVLMNAREVDSGKLAELMNRLQREGNRPATPQEFENVFKQPAQQMPLKISTPEFKAPVTNPDKPTNGAGKCPCGVNCECDTGKQKVFGDMPKEQTPEGFPADGVDLEKVKEGASVNGEKVDPKVIKSLLSAKVDTLNDISGKPWVIVTGQPNQQKDVITQFTPAMLKGMNLKTLTPEQVKDRDLNFLTSPDEPVITVTDAKGNLVMNKTGAKGAQQAVAEVIGQKYDPAKDPDAKPKPAPVVAPDNTVTMPTNLIEILKYILPLLAGFFGGDWWRKKQAQQAEKDKLVNDLLASAKLQKEQVKT